jgi:hypothetical protein
MQELHNPIGGELKIAPKGFILGVKTKVCQNGLEQPHLLAWSACLCKALVVGVVHSRPMSLLCLSTNNILSHP